jgi:hypothetical protein
MQFYLSIFMPAVCVASRHVAPYIRSFVAKQAAKSPSYFLPRACHVPQGRLFSAMPPKKQQNGDQKKGEKNGDTVHPQAHQFQAGDSTNRDIDAWKHREPYRVHSKDEDFPVKWKGSCHCGKVKYQLSREKPLAAKYCHCTTCQRLHGVSVATTVFEIADLSLVTISMGVHLPQVRHQFHERSPRSRMV